MAGDVVKTGVDDLITFLQGQEHVSLFDAAKELNVEPETLQSWVDFLVEEGIVGIEYKFTKPFIYLNRPADEKATIVREEALTWDAYHQTFLEKAVEKKIPDLKAASLWKQHVLQTLEERRQFFLDEARKRDLPDGEALWEKYRTEVLLKI